MRKKDTDLRIFGMSLLTAGVSLMFAALVGAGAWIYLKYQTPTITDLAVQTVMSVHRSRTEDRQYRKDVQDLRASEIEMEAKIQAAERRKRNRDAAFRRDLSRLNRERAQLERDRSALKEKEAEVTEREQSLTEAVTEKCPEVLPQLEAQQTAHRGLVAEMRKALDRERKLRTAMEQALHRAQAMIQDRDVIIGMLRGHNDLLSREIQTHLDYIAKLKKRRVRFGCGTIAGPTIGLNGQFGFGGAGGCGIFF